MKAYQRYSTFYSASKISIVTEMTAETSARDRLLHAAAAMMDESGERALSTRAVCERAGVTAPTLYHHFGSKQGLIDAVIGHGFSQYVDAEEPGADGDDPLAAVRAGWDRHVAFGLDHPRFYTLLYGNLEPGVPCAITAPATARLATLLQAVARAGRLTTAPDDAARQLHAANVGVTLTLIGQPPGAVDRALSDRVRDAAIAGVTTGDGRPSGDVAAAATTLRACLGDGGPLTPGETALMRELLLRVESAPPAGAT